MFSVPVCYSIYNWAIPEKNKLREGEGVEDIPFCKPPRPSKFFYFITGNPRKNKFLPPGTPQNCVTPLRNLKA